MIRNMAKIDLDKFISSICNNGYGSLSLGDIKQALTDQELEYKDGEIVQKSEEISEDKDREYACQTKPENYTRREIMIYNLGIFEGKKMAEDNKIRKELKMITEDYCSYEVAKLLKEKGFEGVCDYAYSNKGNYFEIDRSNFDEIYCLMPTLQMVMRWLREVHNIMVSPYALSLGYYFEIFDLTTRDITGCKPLYQVGIPNKKYVLSTYEGAVEAALKYCLENLI